MQAFDLEFDDTGKTDDPELEVLVHAAGFYSTRQFLYELRKWSWEVDTIKMRLRRVCIMIHKREKARYYKQHPELLELLDE